MKKINQGNVRITNICLEMINISLFDDDVQRFVLKRAVRYGVAVRRDVIEAFNGTLRTTKASTLMSKAAHRWPQTLERGTHDVRLRQAAEIPREASEEDLVKCLDYGHTAFRDTGLRPDELSVVVVKWSRSLPRKPGVFSRIVSGLVRYEPIEIRYVGLRKGEVARWRRILPITLEKMGDQWRVIAQDLDDSEGAYPFKVFVLTRILDARESSSKLPPNIIRQDYSDTSIRIPVRLNPELTPDQQAVIRHELMIQDDKIAVAKRSRFELLRRLSDMPPNPDAVWPLLYVPDED